MTTRRNFIAGAGLTLGAGLAGVRPAWAASGTLPLASLGMGNFHQTMTKVLSRSGTIVVPSYRFGVVMRSGISATGSSGSVSVQAAADLVGVDLAMMQRLAGQAHADFIARLRQTGRTVLGWNDISATKGAAKFKTTPVPFLKKPFADARSVALVSPAQMPLINLHIDAPISDQSPFELGNWRAINSISAELKALVMIPTVVLDFAQMSGSGHKVYSGAANVGIKPGFYLVPQFTQFSFFHAKIALAGEGGRLILTDRAAIGQAGELVKTGSTNNRAEIEEWNRYVRSMEWWNNPWAAGPQRPTQAYDYSSYQYRIDPALFEQVCLDGATAANAIYAGAVAANPAG
jgi:hypothetical protein